MGGKSLAHARSANVRYDSQAMGRFTHGFTEVTIRVEHVEG